MQDFPKHIELPARLIDYFSPNNKSNIHQTFLYVTVYVYDYITHIYSVSMWTRPMCAE